MITTCVNLVVLSLLTWLVFWCTGASISPITSSSVKIIASKNEGLVLERKEAKKSENTSRNTQLMSHEELVSEMIEMRKELKNQNKRLKFQEKRIETQEKRISLLESANSRNKKIDREEARAYTNQRLKTEMRQANFDSKPNRVKRKASLHGSENPNSAISIEGTETVKSSADDAGVHFFVQRNRPWSNEGAIPFQIEKLNIGGAIDVSTGIFTAPQDGVYHFSFSGMMKSGMGKLFVLLRRNMNETIAVAHGDVGANTIISPMISFTATVRLQKDDRIDLFKNDKRGILYDSSYYSYTSYTGSLLMDL